MENFFLGYSDLKHIKICKTSEKVILTFFHAFGNRTDFHQLIHKTDHVVDVTKIKRCLQGASVVSESLSNADDYLRNNFSDEPIIVFKGR